MLFDQFSQVSDLSSFHVNRWRMGHDSQKIDLAKGPDYLWVGLFAQAAGCGVRLIDDHSGYHDPPIAQSFQCQERMVDGAQRGPGYQNHGESQIFDQVDHQVIPINRHHDASCPLDHQSTVVFLQP